MRKSKNILEMPRLNKFLFFILGLLVGVGAVCFLILLDDFTLEKSIRIDYIFQIVIAAVVVVYLQYVIKSSSDQKGFIKSTIAKDFTELLEILDNIGDTASLVLENQITDGQHETRILLLSKFKQFSRKLTTLETLGRYLNNTIPSEDLQNLRCNFQNLKERITKESLPKPYSSTFEKTAFLIKKIIIEL